MSKTACRTVLLALTLFLLLPAATTAQTKKNSRTDHSASQAQKAAEKTPQKLPLQTLTLISTSEAARKAAEEVNSRKKSSKGAPPTLSQAGTKPEGDSAVSEFQADDSSSLSSSADDTFHVKTHKKSALKNIHGSVYGATASGVGNANAVDGAVGADSGNGKFNIYIEGDHSRANTTGPH